METEEKDMNEKKTFKRRTVLKDLLGIPVSGYFTIEALRKVNFNNDKKSRIIKELGLDEIKAPKIHTGSSGKKGDLLRLGMIGFGNRAQQLSRSLGFIHPDEVKRRKDAGTLAEWLEQEDLNVALTGICDVFDLHAEKGLAIAHNEICPGGDSGQNLSVSRYLSYQDLLNDKDIDNVVFQQAREIIKRDILGKITMIETTTNRNTPHGAWIRHLDSNGDPKPGDERSIDWLQWLGSRPYKPFSTDRFYNWTKWFDYDTGMIGQLFTHEFDVVNQLLRIGIPKSAVASGGIYYWKDNREIPDVLHAVFEYPEKGMALTYSANLASSRQRGRVFNGHDASMELGRALSITVDMDSTRYKEYIKQGIIDAITSATEKYYASRGLTTTSINGKSVDVTHLHIKEWIDGIRTGSRTSANIERAFEEGVACMMANKSYLEKRRVERDSVNRMIV